MADADLDEIQHLVRYTLKAASTVNRKTISEGNSDLSILSEPWILPVTCSQLVSSDTEMKKPRFDDPHPEVDTLDIIRAFCHPHVIEIVSQILRGEFKT